MSVWRWTVDGSKKVNNEDKVVIHLHLDMTSALETLGQFCVYFVYYVYYLYILWSNMEVDS